MKKFGGPGWAGWVGWAGWAGGAGWAGWAGWAGLAGRHTLRTQGFREQLARLEASQEVNFEPKPLFLKCLSDVAKIGFDADFGSPETVRVWTKRDVQKSL